MGKEEESQRFTMPPRPKGLLEELVERASRKDNKLANSVRAHIRRLKQEDRFDEAMLVRKEALKARGARFLSPEYISQARAHTKLNETLRELLGTDDETREAELAIRAIWLLEITGEIDSEKRIRELEELVDSKGDQIKAYLESKLPEIRDEMEKFKS